MPDAARSGQRRHVDRHLLLIARQSRQSRDVVRVFVGHDDRGEAIRPFFRTSLSIEDKSANRDFDPVTEADRAEEAVMRRLIKASFPQHGIVGEEFGN